ncbi:hypothetical protein D5E69_09375 [Rossellomorea marisflavi]|uniref:UPF0223 family protein n=1 Tax=Rossellomorea marisflavi TaxID=189381 RepID=UPI0013166AB9|nr:UPF0223 family protein [Rossellomorea marisflavi]QHA36009.1 hypothetical protein D5E69_09375 [Rossellomorea marisflavi]
MEYQYPFDIDWTTEEVIDVIAFFESIEQAYEKSIDRDELMKKYKRFKEIVPGKADEKRICGEFQQSSGYSSYYVIKKMKDQPESGRISM